MLCFIGMVLSVFHPQWVQYLNPGFQFKNSQILGMSHNLEYWTYVQLFIIILSPHRFYYINMNELLKFKDVFLVTTSNSTQQISSVFNLGTHPLDHFTIYMTWRSFEEAFFFKTLLTSSPLIMSLGLNYILLIYHHLWARWKITIVITFFTG